MAYTVETTARLLGRDGNARFDRLMPNHANRLNQQAEQHSHASVVSENFAGLLLKLCAFMGVAAVVIYAAAAFYGSIVAEGGHSSDTTQHQIVIGSDLITVPENMIRFRSQRTTGDMGRLDLYAHWPSMSGYSEQYSAAFNSMDASASVIFVSLEPRDMSKDMSGRVSSIYEKFFSGPPIDSGNGLVRRAFSSESAYFSEDLFYEAGSPYPFAARCVRESDKIAGNFCIRDIHIGRDLMLTYRFHANLLPDWLALDRTIRETFTQMIAR